MPILIKAPSHYLVLAIWAASQCSIYSFSAPPCKVNGNFAATKNMQWLATSLDIPMVASGARVEMSMSAAAAGAGTATPKKRSGGSGGGGMGMGMGGGNNAKQKGKKNKGKNKKSATATPFDVSASVMRLEKAYDELLVESAKALQSASDDYYDDDVQDVFSEYMVAARCDPSYRGGAATSDWIPVAQLCIVRPIDEDDHRRTSTTEHYGSGQGGDPRVRAAVSNYCREIYFAASLAAPTLKSIPRNLVQYSVEPLDSFYKFVYEDVFEGKHERDLTNGVSMTKAQARETLRLDADCNDAAEIKRAYRQLSFESHPDRFVGEGKSDEDVQARSIEFGRVKLAYETLRSGVRDTASGNGSASSRRSWYESLGGGQRTEFSGPVELLPRSEAHGLAKAFKSALVGIDPDTVMAFVVRNQAGQR